MSLRRRILLGTAAALASCAGPRGVPPLASARLVSDFESYTIQRVGLLPPAGLALGQDQADELQAAFLAEFSAATDYEIIRLSAHDLEALPAMDPHRRGDYRPETILAVARRYRLDALLIPTVTDLQSHPPQRLGLQVDLLSTETGQALWASSIQLDAAKERVRESLERWAAEEVGDVSPNTWELTLISPRRFARFAAFSDPAVRETIPDRILDEAAEVELVDLSPDELLQRLRDGKVYVPEQAQHAV